jgi:hypothetical protein
MILQEVKRNLKLMGLNEEQLDIDFTDSSNDDTFKGYIDIVESEDNDPKNLNIEFIQNNRRFAKMFNTLLFEVYKDNLGWNDDKSKYGIIDIFTLNELTNWSVLNYFGGHKYVKNRLLDNFNRTNNGNTPKDFYKWLIEEKMKLFKDCPIKK